MNSLTFIYDGYSRLKTRSIELDIAKNFGNVEFLDIRGAFTLLPFEKQSNESYGEENLPKIPIKISGFFSLLNFLKKEKTIAIVSLAEDWRHWWIFFLLKLTGTKTVRLNLTSAYMPQLFDKNAGDPTNRHGFFKKNLNRILFFMYLFFTKMGVFAKYDLYFISGKKSAKEITKYNRYGEVVLCHSSIYEEFLKQDFTIAEEYIVFIDFAVPYLKDWDDWGYKKISPKEYYSPLIEFFRKIEEASDKKVIVCAHPQYPMEKATEDFGEDFTVVQYKTDEYIAKAKYVALHASSAIYKAVLYKKPILLLDSEKLNEYIKLDLKQKKEMLGLDVVDYEKISKEGLRDILNKIKINELKYQQLKSDFLYVENNLKMDILTMIIKKMETL